MEVETRSTGAPKWVLGEPRNEEGGQGRPQAARRGSLEGPVSCSSHHGRRSPPGLRGRPLCCRVGDALRSISRASKCWRATRSPGCRSSLRPNCDMEWFGRNLVGSIS